ncbi:oligosaccharide flippase family protein [Pseudoalteromonas sp. NEC-BIFX-2020_015]|uniref:lipopolysaccharide biosynthesis protein n=1 Tax=Pseudoalteromonas sp. NEC-BIFX-2020_015 TaxID=2729544 RepID=UPI0014613E51|nr:oligosaccharide flippase family protein [Pseudoalteromonas sp. NEC-BIFX-2020_015]NMR26813.1 oligosaccharide flippase family protein [Pseudoalteromonas sp. NEC-BIFX-2020_015]
MNLRKILLFALGPLGNSVLGLFILPISAWFFTTEDIGRLSMYQLVVSFSIILFGLGLDQGYVREYHDSPGCQKDKLFKTLFLSAITVLFLVVLVSLLIPVELSYLVTGIQSKWISLYIILGVVFAFISRFLALILRMNERALAYSLSQLLPKLLFLFVLLSYLYFEVESEFESLIAAQLAGVVSAFVILIINTRISLIDAIKESFDLILLKRILLYTVPLIGSGLTFWGLAATDKFLLRLLSTFEELGVYSMAYSFSAVALILQAIFSTVWAPQVYKWASKGGGGENVKDSVQIIALVICLVWSFVGLLSWLSLLILPDEYARVDVLILAVIAYPLLYTLSEATGVGIGVKRKTMYALLATFIALVINFFGNYLLIPLFQAEGAAISSAISFFIFFIIKTEYSNRIWVEFERFRMYLIISIHIALACFLNLFTKTPLELRLFLYTGITLFTLILFWNEVKRSIGFMNNYRKLKR